MRTPLLWSCCCLWRTYCPPSKIIITPSNASSTSSFQLPKEIVRERKENRVKEKAMLFISFWGEMGLASSSSADPAVSVDSHCHSLPQDQLAVPALALLEDQS